MTDCPEGALLVLGRVSTGLDVPDAAELAGLPEPGAVAGWCANRPEAHNDPLATRATLAAASQARFGRRVLGVPRGWWTRARTSSKGGVDEVGLHGVLGPSDQPGDLGDGKIGEVVQGDHLTLVPGQPTQASEQHETLGARAAGIHGVVAAGEDRLASGEASRTAVTRPRYVERGHP